MNSAKKLLFKAILFFMILTEITFLPQKAYANNDDFVVKNDILVQYKGFDEDVVIPDGVTDIGYNAFYGCYDLNSVFIPNGVNSIGQGAFYMCSNLTNVTLPDGIDIIGDGAFFKCSKLTNIILPKSVAMIGDNTFLGCNNLTICCYASSYAESYAKKNGYAYVIIETENTDNSTGTASSDKQAETSTTGNNRYSYDSMLSDNTTDNNDTEGNNHEIIKAGYIMQKDQIKYKDPAGKVRGIVYFQYPQFQETSASIKKINEQLKKKSKQALKSKTAKSIKKCTKEAIQDGRFSYDKNGKFYWTTSCKVSYNKNNIISLHMTEEWLAGGVGNTNEYGINYNLKTGKKLTVNNVISGNTKEKILKAAKDYCGSDTNAYNIIKNKTNYDFYFSKGKVYICFKSYEHRFTTFE